MEGSSSHGSSSFSLSKMQQFGVGNETDEISSSGLKGEPVESLNDVRIAGTDSKTKIGGCKSDPSPAERQRRRKHYEISKRYMEKIKGLHILGTNSESVDKFSSMELAVSHPISNGCANGADILAKLELDECSKVSLSHFTGLGGERIPVGKFNFPPSLYQIVKNITDVYGDVSSTMNLIVAEPIYIMFCASIREMSELCLEQVTENLMLKWRDAIKDALRIGFTVNFAMEHLKKVARAYIGLMERRKLDNMASGIPSLEGQFGAGKSEHYKISKMSKIYMDAAEEFTGKAVSWGLF